ncbi:MAG TPA: phosphoesterase [Ruminococcaceae bacterium]|nr:phosphoesterase [Oscillospiraceae bacterium]HCA28521.1 phosphoesterase [Oscillospiraceae bacterium]
MKVYYDLHIHSCLSPCGDDDMTPNNIVNMALLAGLDMIALTDHNSSKNCPAIVKAAKKNGLIVIAGMELCTAEECHVICLFPTLEAAMEFDALVEAKLPPVKNQSDIFGTQIIMDEDDRVTGTCSTLLTTASSISIDDVPQLVQKYGGSTFPAHIDRDSYSVVASLGTIPDVGFHAFEISRFGDTDRLVKEQPVIQGWPLLCNSDAHCLSLIQDFGPWIELENNRPADLIAALSGKTPCQWGTYNP